MSTRRRKGRCGSRAQARHIASARDEWHRWARSLRMPALAIEWRVPRVERRRPVKLFARGSRRWPAAHQLIDLHQSKSSAWLIGDLQQERSMTQERTSTVSQQFTDLGRQSINAMMG